jgi:hypothetical protein
VSSHREAPQIAKDPVADSADLYAFVNPANPGHVTIIANYVPLQAPDAGPNFYEFGDDVLYTIYIDNDGDADWNIAFNFQFTTTVADRGSFLYNDGPIESLDSANWNRRQFYTLTRQIKDNQGRITTTTLGTNLACPPCNIGPLSTPNYTELASAAVHHLQVDGRFMGFAFAGQRADGFVVDLGSVFDLGTLRPFQQDHATFGLTGTPLGAMAAGINSLDTINVHSLAIDMPIGDLTRNGIAPTSVTDPAAVIGVWTTASRRSVTVRGADGVSTETGPWVQVSRLGNPLVNEVLIGMGIKDYWNSLTPATDSQFMVNYKVPQLPNLLPVLYPGVFPKLAAYNANKPDRADLVAILLTGIPNGVIPGATYTTFTGPTLSDMLRLNVAIPPAKAPNILGLLGGDVAGFPNGRRVFDDVTTIELRALAGATLPLVDKNFTADAAAGAITAVQATATDTTYGGTETYLGAFPFLGTPHSGYNAGTPQAVSG